MNRSIALPAIAAAALLLAGSAIAQAPAGAPAGSTGQCKDGSYSSQPSKKGACRGHKGVAEWYAGDTATAAAAAPAKAPRASKAAKAAAAAPAAPADAGARPGGATGQCKDGSYSTQASKKGACRGHKGVAEWYAGEMAAAPAAPSMPASPAAPAAAPAAPMQAAPAMPAAPAAPATAGHRPAQFTPPANAAPGGGPGMVWANGGSKVYHCPGDRWYGKTKSGSYMSEADAKAQGMHPDHGKACSN